MRTWFNRHPNAAFILCVAWAFAMAGIFVARLNDGEWLYAGIAFVALVAASWHAVNFWERT